MPLRSRSIDSRPVSVSAAVGLLAVAITAGGVAAGQTVNGPFAFDPIVGFARHHGVGSGSAVGDPRRVQPGAGVRGGRPRHLPGPAGR